MTVELIRGQNHLLPQARLEIRISAGKPVVAGVTLGDDSGRLREAGWMAHPAAPQLPGLEVPRQAAADHRLAVDLDAVQPEVHRVNVLLALPTGVGGPVDFGALTAPFVSVTGLDGVGIASYTIVGLEAESAVVALELYRRNDSWKVRAIGQGYAGGLAAMLEDQGLDEAGKLAATINEAVADGMARAVAAPPPRPGEEAAEDPSADDVGVDGPPTNADGRISYQHPSRRPSVTPPEDAGQSSAGAGSAGAAPVAGDASGWSMNERLYNQVWAMFEELARTVAACRSAIDFADSRREQRMEKVLSDPRTRVGPAADAAREEAQKQYRRLVEQANAAFDRDVGQLVAEAEVVEPALPPAFARWDSPVWQTYEVPMERPMALRLGDLTLPERTDLPIPMLVRLPLERGLWVDSGREASVESSLVDSGELRRLAADTAVAIAARLVAVHPIGDFSLHAIDPAGSAATSLSPLLESGALREAPPVGADGVAQVLEKLTQRVDLVQMAVRSGATASLPPDLDTAEQLLIVHDFPHGFDDRAVNQLRYIADEGPSVGVTVLMVADREDARAYGPVLDPLWRSLLRITPVPSEHLADPWVGHAWTYQPPLAPPDSGVVPRVLEQVATAREAYGR